MIGKKKGTKKGTIRGGPFKKPYVRSTQQELEDRIEWVEGMMREGPLLRGEMVRRIKDRFDVDHRTAGDYISRARQRLILKVKESKDEWRSKSMAFYEGVLTDDFATTHDKLVAQRRIDKLLGLEIQPVVYSKIEHSGNVQTTPKGVPIDELDISIEMKRDLLKAMRNQQEKE